MNPLEMQWNAQVKMLAILSFFIASIAPDAYAQMQVYDSDQRRVEVCFNSTLTQKDIDKFQQTMFMYGIVLSYDTVTFDRKGRLESIGFTVDCKDGFTGGARTESLKKKSRFGFFRDYAADATVSNPPFGVGDLNPPSNTEGDQRL